MYLPRVAIVSMGSHCTFQFVSNDLQRRPMTSLLLPRRGLLVFEADAYEKFLHTVPSVHADVLADCTHRLDAEPDGTRATTETSSFLAAMAVRATDALPPGSPPGVQESSRVLVSGRGNGSLLRDRRLSLTVRRVLKVRPRLTEPE